MLTSYAFFNKAIQNMSETIQDDSVFICLQDLKVKTLSAMAIPIASLKKVSKIKLSETQSSLVLTYELYGNLDYEVDLITRNQIEHPGFFPAYQSLEVLS
jgi:prophage DNA circulation protein